MLTDLEYYLPYLWPHLINIQNDKNTNIKYWDFSIGGFCDRNIYVKSSYCDYNTSIETIYIRNTSIKAIFIKNTYIEDVYEDGINVIKCLEIQWE